MRDIETWLEKFRENWKAGKVDQVLQLFTEDVDYYETPFLQLENDELRAEWRGVKNQQDIVLEFDVFSRENEKFVVQWSLEYVEDGGTNSLKGIYLIKLDSDNKCYEFWQYCESKN